jgi:hypothetical protein
MAQRQSSVRRFIQLTDVPQSYTGLGNRIVSVKGTENGLETIPQSAGPVATFLSLTDTPGSYAGASNVMVKVNSAANALVFADSSVLVVNANVLLTRANDIILINAGIGNVTVTLPDATTIAGHIYNIKRVDLTTNIVQLVSGVGQVIEGFTNYLFNTQYQSVTLVAATGNYYII